MTARLPFLTLDELTALEHLLTDARYDARRDHQAGGTIQAVDAEETIAIVQGIIDRHQALTLQERAR